MAQAIATLNGCLGRRDAAGMPFGDALGMAGRGEWDWMGLDGTGWYRLKMKALTGDDGNLGQLTMRMVLTPGHWAKKMNIQWFRS